MNHIVYITGGCDTTPNPEYPLGQKVTPDARRLKDKGKRGKIRASRVGPLGASGQSQLINGAKRCAVTQRQDVLAVAIHRWLGALNMARDREEPHGTVRKRCRPGKKQRRASLGRAGQGGALHEFQNLSIILNSVFI
ncbi:Electron transfer flavoprotein subunit beta [Trichinella spiralis]|uniref:Electron transfer flavoprotein subunit beta n=1 Tax=Trichinella spiralis TaxID=6334 RepID=A0ABR3KPA2_TRISP